jgi:uncharacterized membrane protein YbjE (DUF340 family)
MGLFRPVAGQLYFYCVVVNVENTFLSFGWNSSLYSVEKFVCNYTLYILIFVVKSGVLTVRSSSQCYYECSDINSAYVLVNVILTCYCTCSLSALLLDIPHRSYAILYGCGWLSLTSVIAESYMALWQVPPKGPGISSYWGTIWKTNAKSGATRCTWLHGAVLII